MTTLIGFFAKAIEKEWKMRLFDILFAHPMAILILALLFPPSEAFAQKAGDTRVPTELSGGITVTNNGISLIPTFTLGKPAVTFDLAIGKKKLSFEPEFQFSLDGKPWTFFFWGRYKLVSNQKFFIRTGLHESLAFSTSTTTVNGVSKESISAQRYLAGEFAPNYFLTKHLGIGIYYIYSYGIDNEFVRNTNLLMFHVNFSNLKLSDQWSASIMPQIYYLRINQNNGFNLTTSLSLVKRNFPILFSAFVNKTLSYGIPGSKNFVWNASLIYTFHRNLVER